MMEGRYQKGRDAEGKDCWKAIAEIMFEANNLELAML